MFLLSPSLIFLSTLLQLVISSPTHGNSALHLPLRRRATAGKFMDVASVADKMRTKYGYDPVHKDKALQRRASTTGVAIGDEDGDTSYFAPLEIGTPSQQFNVILDTGSSDLWLSSVACRQGCQGAQLYDFTSSSSFSDQNAPVTVQYGSGAVAGELATETVAMGGFTVQKQGFIAATAVSQGLLGENLSGLIGLGFQPLAQTQATPFVQALFQNNNLNSPEMSFFLERQINNPNAADLAPGGTLTLGGTNSSLFQGSVQFIDFPNGASPSFWLIPVDAVSVQGHSISVDSSESTAAIDTGTTLVGVPSDIFNEVCSQIPNSQNGTGQLATFCVIPCNTDVNAAMTFGGKSWSINPADFSIPQQGNNGQTVCVAAMFDLNPSTGPTPGGPLNKRQNNNLETPDWIVGDAFLKNVYTVFRFSPPSVGFAQLSSGGGGPGSPTSTNSGMSQNSSPSGAPSSSTTPPPPAQAPSSLPTQSFVPEPITSANSSPFDSGSSSNTSSALSPRLHTTLLGVACAVVVAVISLW